MGVTMLAKPGFLFYSDMTYITTKKARITAQKYDYGPLFAHTGESPLRKTTTITYPKSGLQITASTTKIITTTFIKAPNDNLHK